MKYHSTMLMIDGKYPIIRSNRCEIHPIELGGMGLIGYFPRLTRLASPKFEGNDTIEQFNEFTAKLSQVCATWHIPVSHYSCDVLGCATLNYIRVSESFQDLLERILCAYYGVIIEI